MTRFISLREQEWNFCNLLVIKSSARRYKIIDQSQHIKDLIDAIKAFLWRLVHFIFIYFPCVTCCLRFRQFKQLIPYYWAAVPKLNGNLDKKKRVSLFFAAKAFWKNIFLCEPTFPSSPRNAFVTCARDQIQFPVLSQLVSQGLIISNLVPKCNFSHYIVGIVLSRIWLLICVIEV